MRPGPITFTLTITLLTLSLATQAAARPACNNKHHHPRTIHSRDKCAHALRAPKVALLFLTKGPVPFERMWRRWFHDIGHLAYSGCVDWYGDHFLECGRELEEAAHPIAQQHLFTVYVHTPPDFHGYPKDHLFHAGCEGVPAYSEYEALRRRLGADEEEYPAYTMAKTSQWFLLTRAHAELADRHSDDRLLSWPDEWYVASLLKTFRLENETTCDWQGPTYTNWTGTEDHPATYYELDSDTLRRMRVSSIFASVACDWRAALDQAADPAHFFNAATWEWLGKAPAFEPMHGSCPLFARKLSPEAQTSFMAALWP